MRLEDNARGYLELIPWIPDGGEDTESFPAGCSLFRGSFGSILPECSFSLCCDAELLKVKVQLTATNSSKLKSHYCQLSFAAMCQRGILTSKLAC